MLKNAFLIYFCVPVRADDSNLWANAIIPISFFIDTLPFVYRARVIYCGDVGVFENVVFDISKTGWASDGR